MVISKGVLGNSWVEVLKNGLDKGFSGISSGSVYKQNVLPSSQPNPNFLSPRFFFPPPVSSSSDPNLICFKCLERGHFRKDCRNAMVCHHCGGLGHIRPNCPDRKLGVANASHVGGRSSHSRSAFGATRGGHPGSGSNRGRDIQIWEEGARQVWDPHSQASSALGSTIGGHSAGILGSSPKVSGDLEKGKSIEKEEKVSDNSQRVMVSSSGCDKFVEFFCEFSPDMLIAKEKIMLEGVLSFSKGSLLHDEIIVLLKARSGGISHNWDLRVLKNGNIVFSCPSAACLDRLVTSGEVNVGRALILIRKWGEFGCHRGEGPKEKLRVLISGVPPFVASISSISHISRNIGEVIGVVSSSRLGSGCWEHVVDFLVPKEWFHISEYKLWIGDHFYLISLSYPDESLPVSNFENSKQEVGLPHLSLPKVSSPSSSSLLPSNSPKGGNQGQSAVGWTKGGYIRSYQWRRKLAQSWSPWESCDQTCPKKDLQHSNIWMNAVVSEKVATQKYQVVEDNNLNDVFLLESDSGLIEVEEGEVVENFLASLEENVSELHSSSWLLPPSMNSFFSFLCWRFDFGVINMTRFFLLVFLEGLDWLRLLAWWDDAQSLLSTLEWKEEENWCKALVPFSFPEDSVSPELGSSSEQVESSDFLTPLACSPPLSTKRKRTVVKGFVRRSLRIKGKHAVSTPILDRASLAAQVRNLEIPPPLVDESETGMKYGSVYSVHFDSFSSSDLSFLIENLGLQGSSSADLDSIFSLERARAGVDVVYS